MSVSAYIAFYKGVQLGDECFMIAPGISAEPPRVSRLFRSPLAVIHRPTTGKLWVYRLTVHLIRDTPAAVAAQVDQYAALITDEPGTLEIYQNPTSPVLVKTIEDAWLVEPQPQTDPEPSRARVTPVTFEFLSTTRPT